MAAEKKEISPDTNLKALALFTIAQQHYTKCREMEQALFDLLEYKDDSGPYCGNLSDEIYNESGSFGRGMKSEGFVVKHPRVKKART